MVSRDAAAAYIMANQAEWEPQMLRALLKSGETAWQTEMRGSQRAKIYRSYRFMGTRGWGLRYHNYLRRGKPDRRAQFWMFLHP